MLFEHRAFSMEPINASNLNLFSNYYEEQLIYKSEIIEQLLSYSKNTRCIEVSAALGTVSFDMLHKDKEISLIIQEQSQTCVEEINRHIQENRLNERCSVISSNVENLPFNDESFDVIFSINALRNWNHPHLVIEEMRRILVPGGKIIINDLRRDLLEPFAEYRIRELQGIRDGEWMIRNFINSWKSSYSINEVSVILDQSKQKDYKVIEDGPMAMSIEIVKE